MMLEAWYHFYKLIFVKILWILSIEHQKMLSNHHLAKLCLCNWNLSHFQDSVLKVRLLKVRIFEKCA